MISQNTYLHKDIDGSKGFIQSSKTREELYSTVLRHPLIQSLPHEQNGNSCQMKQKFQNQQSRQISQLMNLGTRNYFKTRKGTAALYEPFVKAIISGSFELEKSCLSLCEKHTSEIRSKCLRQIAIKQKIWYNPRQAT